MCDEDKAIAVEPRDVTVANFLQRGESADVIRGWFSF